MEHAVDSLVYRASVRFNGAWAILINPSNEISRSVVSLSLSLPLTFSHLLFSVFSVITVGLVSPLICALKPRKTTLRG